MIEKELEKYFGFSSFNKGQKEVVSRLLKGESSAAIFPTGAGKSLCYQLPAMLLPGLTLVVSPLLSLMKDQTDFLKSLGIRAERLDSSLGEDEYASVLERAVRGDIKILMISVERLRNERFRGKLRQIRISMLVIDEAHCISEWGHNFRPDYLKLPEARKEFGMDLVLLLTATATENVVKDMCEKFAIDRHNVICTGFYRPNLFLQVSSVPESSKKKYLLKRILRVPDAPTIIYVTLQKTAEDVASFLTDNGINTWAYHAGMNNEERERIQNEFITGRITCISATIAFGMGIDKKDIRRVIHFDLPKSMENYSQEIGRAGRDGKLSFCEVLASRGSLSVLENFVYGDTPQRESIRKFVGIIREHPEQMLEIKPFTLSAALDIRILPFKTLTVYLEIQGVIRSVYTRFDEYTFRYLIPSGEIEASFQGERRDFVSAILRNSHQKKIWNHVDIESIITGYQGSDRSRIINALEYFDGKGWIELKAGQSVDVYEIVSRDFDVDDLASRLFGLFSSKEEIEIGRIRHMVDFFEKDSCLSAGLAEYFGETIPNQSCGHCSFCRSGRVFLAEGESLPSLGDMSGPEIYGDFAEKAGPGLSALNAAKFLCGISSPFLVRLGAKKIRNYGLLEKYPFAEVLEWAGKTWADKSDEA